MNPMKPSILLSALLLSCSYGAPEWTIDTLEFKNLDNTVVDGVALRGSGNLILNSQGNSTIKQMQMYWLNERSGATFNVNSGNLNLDLSIANMDYVQNQVNFNVDRDATLTLTGGGNGGNGIFQGIGTILQVGLSGTLKGSISNDLRSTIEVRRGGVFEGNITQTAGNLDATIEGKLDGNLLMTKNVTQSNLWANTTQGVTQISAIITGNIVQEGGMLNGIMKGLELQGNFTQIGGQSDIAFHKSIFRGNSTIVQSNALLHFYESTLKSISVTGGRATINLKGRQNSGEGGSHMEGYIGIDSQTTINMIQKSSMQAASQTKGFLTLKADNSKVDGSITGSDARLVATLTKSEVIGNITNSKNNEPTQNAGFTEITATRSLITGNISQNGGTMLANLDETTLKGGFIQNGGILRQIRAVGNSLIDQGIFLTGVERGNTDEQITLENTRVNNGIHIKRLKSQITGSISDNSSVQGGYFQDGGNRAELNFKQSSLKDGVQVYDSGRIQLGFKDPQSYMSTLRFTQNSSYTGGVTSNNHSLWITLNASRGEGNLAITNSDFYLESGEQSQILGNLVAQNSNTILNINQTRFDGFIRQTQGKQYAEFNNSQLTGDYHNIDTQTTLIVDQNSQIQNYLQDRGTLLLKLGGNAVIERNVVLNNVSTILANTRADNNSETIRGDFTQNGGSIVGGLGGLRLEGQYTQNGGTSLVSFDGANFLRPTEINNATRSHITFLQSLLKDYTINRGEDNTLILDNATTLDGHFRLNHGKASLSVINKSVITGNIISEDEDSELDLNMKDGRVDGDIIISKGKIDGNLSGSTIGGDLGLTDADSDLNLKGSTIEGNVHIKNGTNHIQLNQTKIGGWFKMEGEGPNTPTLLLHVENETSIGGDLSFLKTHAFVGGKWGGSLIKGSLISQDSTLTHGPDPFHPEQDWLSHFEGLTIAQDLKQERGVMDLVFKNSNVQGGVEITDAVRSNLKFDQSSSIHKVQISGTEDSQITLSNQSKQEWGGDGIILTDSKVVINAQNDSSITSNIKVISNNNYLSKTEIYLREGSAMVGDITQNSGTLLVDLRDSSANRSSSLRGNISIDSLQSATINAFNRSEIVGNLATTKTPVEINLTNRSLMDSTITSTATPLLKISANQNSTLRGSIIHTGAVQSANKDLVMSFKNNSLLDNNKMTLIGQIQIDSNRSTINSSTIELISGIINLNLANQSSGIIKDFSTGGSNTVNIHTTTDSNSEILALKISDRATLNLVADSRARISGTLTTTKTVNATLVALGNATIAFDVIPQDQTDLQISLNGGILQGKIVQDTPALGNAVLGANGQFGGRWVMTEDSALKDLIINNSSALVQDNNLMQDNVWNTQISMVDMTRKDAMGNIRTDLQIIPQGEPAENQTVARTLSLASLSGLNGVFRIYTDIGAELSDKITAQQARGNHIMQVYYNRETFTQDLGDKYIVVAHVDDPETTASFTGETTEVGNQAFQTELLKVDAREGRGFDWILGSTKNTGNAYGTKVIASILQSQYRSFAIQTETLNQRLGELKDTNRIHGIWARYTMGETQTKEKENHITLKDQFYSAWFGYDYNTLNLRGQNFVGFALSYTLVAPNSKDYTGNIHNVGFNFYDVFVAKNDFYVDVVAKYILSQGSYDIQYRSLSNNSPEYINHKFMASLEIGKKFKLGAKRRNYFYLQPEAQVIGGFISGNELSFTDLMGTKIDASLAYTFPVIFRAGLSAAYAMEYSGFRGDFRLGTSFVYEMSNGGKITLDDADSIVKYKYGGEFHLVLHAGTNLIFNDSARIYFEASTGFFGTTSTNYAINAGVRFIFGPKNTRRLKIPSAPPPPPPPPEYDPRNIPVIMDNTKDDIRSNLEEKKTPTYDSDYFINTRKSFRDVTSLKTN